MATSDPQFTKQVLNLAGSEVRSCIQCGTCSAACPTAHLMDNSIRRLVKLVLEGKKVEALQSGSIWLCTSCLLCTVRCPRGIKPRVLVGALKDIFERDGRKGKDQAYEDLFTRQIKEDGRISETVLSAQYLLANPMSAVQTMEMGLELLPRGKIVMEKDKINGIDEVKKIFAELGKG
jgi:heterodisulfide reductase subunit C2